MERGTVVDFDDRKGFGYLEDADGRRLFFHCTAVAGGGRTIPVGSDVVFDVVAGHGGAWEATSLVPMP